MLTESDVIFTDGKTSPYGEIPVKAEINYSVEAKTHKRYRECLDKEIKDALVHELNYKIWGAKNKELRRWINEQQDKLLCCQMPHELYLEVNRFFSELRNKL